MTEKCAFCRKKKQMSAAQMVRPFLHALYVQHQTSSIFNFSTCFFLLLLLCVFFSTLFIFFAHNFHCLLLLLLLTSPFSSTPLTILAFAVCIYIHRFTIRMLHTVSCLLKRKRVLRVSVVQTTYSLIHHAIHRHAYSLSLSLVV